MALDTPNNAVEIDQRMKVDIKRELPESNPFLPNSWIGAVVTAVANRIFDFYYALKRAQLEAIPDTAVLNLERWAAIYKILKTPATVASGNVVVTGDADTSGIVKDGTTFVSSDGKQYIAKSDDPVILQSLAVASITRVGSVATLTTVSDHLLASNVLIIVTGANESEYNVSNLACTVTGAKILTYAVSGTPATPATGTILLGVVSVAIAVESVEFGSDQNQLFDTILTIQSPITNIDNSVSVDFGALGNGSDQEIDEALRARMLDRIQNPIAHFNVSEITAVAKSIAGVTRVFVQEVTPNIGEVTIYFMRDNDDDPIPNSSEVAVVKAIIDGIKPANADTLDVHVSAPTPETTDFIFTSITPDTSTMRVAIEENLKQFYAENTEIAVNIVEEAYNAAIYNTVDLVTGEKLTAFTLSAPPADIAIAAGKIGKLGNVTF